MVPSPSGLEIRDGHDGQMIKRLPYPLWSDRALAWNPDGSRLAVLQKQEILVLDSETFEVINRIPGPKPPKKNSADQDGFPESHPQVEFQDGQLRFNADGTQLLWYGDACNTSEDDLDEWACVWSLDHPDAPLQGKLDGPELKEALTRFALPRETGQDYNWSSVDGKNSITGTGLSGRYL
jgi:hypothetical protein